MWNLLIMNLINLKTPSSTRSKHERIQSQNKDNNRETQNEIGDPQNPAFLLVKLFLGLGSLRLDHLFLLNVLLYISVLFVFLSSYVDDVEQGGECHVYEACGEAAYPGKDLAHSFYLNRHNILRENAYQSQ